MFFGIEIWAALGFFLAAYAVVGNDALQTLGTFINSNRHLHWTILYAFAALILVATFTYGWQVNGGDPSYGRLDNTAKYPLQAIEWYHILPPLVLLIITRLGIPVSTSFMVLTIFASISGLGSMIEKSVIGYGVAFLLGLVIFVLISKTLERWFEKNPLESFVPFGLIAIGGSAFFLAQYHLFGTIDEENQLWIGIGTVVALEVIGIALALGAGRGFYWVTLQWSTTAYLWSIWLVQDFANIFVFLTTTDENGELTRSLSTAQAFSAMAVILVLLAITFANRGGPVQRILRTKTNVVDIRSATIIDFSYATLLFFFKELSNIPMSTTWVFLGLIAGREFGFALMRQSVSFVRALIDTGEDAAKAFIGIVLSIDLALGLPAIGAWIDGSGLDWTAMFPTPFFTALVVAANLSMFPIVWFAFSRPEQKPSGPKKVMAAVVMVAVIGTAAVSAYRYVDREVFAAPETASLGTALAKAG